MRRGGDVTVFLRLDDKPVRRTSGVYEPDALVVLDPALTAHERVRRGLKEGGLVILNDERSPGEVDMGVKLSKIATVAATEISTEMLGQRAIPITNTALLGAIAKATDWVELDSLFDPIRHTFPGRIGELNIVACKKGYEGVKVKEG